MSTEADERKIRKRPADRISQIINVVDARINAERSAAISMKDISDAVGTSRALVYAYFPDQFRLLDAVLDRHAKLLVEAGVTETSKKQQLVGSAQETAAIYIQHIVAHGSALEIVLREAAIARHLKSTITNIRARVYRRLANLIRAELKMESHEALALVQLLAVIPAEAGSMVAAGSLNLEEALELSNRLIESSIDALRPNPTKR